MIGRLLKRVTDFGRRRPFMSGGVVIAGIALFSWLAFGYFGVQTLFIDDKVNEANPFAAGPGASGLEIDATSDSLAAAINDAMAEDGTPEADSVDEPMEDEFTVVVEGTFIGRAHPTTGVAKVITDGDRRFLRFEGFESDNGPDLNVYIGSGPPDGSPGDFVDLGDLKGNIGDQNYELTDEVDLSRHTTVYIWCVRFSVAFGAAALT